jgi:hypothetical protein
MTAEEPRLREFIGWIKIGDGERTPLSGIYATDVDEAYDMVVAQYGEGHKIGIWNEEDANTIR